MLQLAMDSKYLKSIIHSNYSSLLAGISLEKSAKYSPAATIIIKPERLAHCWTYSSHGYIALAGLNRSQDVMKTIVFLHLQYNFTQSHLALSGNWGQVHYYSSCPIVNVLCKHAYKIHYIKIKLFLKVSHQ